MSSQDAYMEELKTLWREINGLKQRINDLMTEEHLTGVVGDVTSVNGDTGAVVLDADDIGEGVTNLYYSDERARDSVGAALIEGAGIDITVDDPGDTITIASTITQYTDEMARDALGTALVAGTNITITPNDGADTITIDAIGAGLTQEQIEDYVGGMVTGNTETGIAVTYDDSGGKLNFDAQTAGDARYVALTGAQTVAGVKTFSNGIAFANETLSTYDEGTWTPAITGSSTNPTVSYTIQTGTYTRIGNVVFYTINITINTFSGGSGNARFSLPFTLLDDGVGSVINNGIDLPGTPVGVAFNGVAGAAYGMIYVLQDNAAVQVVQISSLAAGDLIRASGAFLV